MKKQISVVILASLLTAPAWPLEGERPALGQSVDAVAQEARVSPRLSFRAITIFLRDGTTVRGRLNGATTGSIRVRQGGEDTDYAFGDIRRVLIRTEALRSRGVAPGIAFGLYVGNGLLVWATGEPGFYLRRISAGELGSVWLLLGEGFFAAMGGGLGWIASSGGSRNSFEFPADPEEARAAQERFARFLAGESAPARIHLLIQSGVLLPGASRRFGEFVRGAGFSLNFHRSYVTKFNALRGLELSVSVKPWLRTGLRVSFPSEPVFDSYMSSIVDGSSTSVSQELRATAFHGIGAVELAGRRRPGGISVSLGLGAGAAAVRLRRDAYTYIPGPYPYGDKSISGIAEVRKTLPSAGAFGSIEFRVTEVLSAGLAADFTFIPAVAVPDLPGNGIAGQKLGLSNGSVGFVIGYHF